jgi:hypothetical protein
MVSDIVFNMFRAQKSGCIREDIVDCFCKFTTIHDIVRLHFADLKRALFGQGSYELECAFQHLYAPHTVWTRKKNITIFH